MEDMKRSAKMEVLKELHKTARDMMKEHMGDMKPDSMKKVTVAAPDEEGLKEGLEKAEDMLGDIPGMHSPEGEMSPEEIDAEIQRLMDMKNRMSSQED